MEDVPGGVVDESSTSICIQHLDRRCAVGILRRGRRATVRVGFDCPAGRQQATSGELRERPIALRILRIGGIATIGIGRLAARTAVRIKGVAAAAAVGRPPGVAGFHTRGIKQYGRDVAGAVVGIRALAAVGEDRRARAGAVRIESVRALAAVGFVPCVADRVAAAVVERRSHIAGAVRDRGFAGAVGIRCGDRVFLRCLGTACIVVGRDDSTFAVIDIAARCAVRLLRCTRTRPVRVVGIRSRRTVGLSPGIARLHACCAGNDGRDIAQSVIAVAGGAAVGVLGQRLRCLAGLRAGRIVVGRDHVTFAVVGVGAAAAVGVCRRPGAGSIRRIGV